MTFSISTNFQDRFENFDNSNFFPEEIVLNTWGARNHKLVNQNDLQIKFCKPNQFTNRLDIKNFLNFDDKILCQYEYQCLTNI